MSKKNALMEDSTTLELVNSEEKNTLNLKSGDTVLSSVDLPAGGGSAFELAGPTGATAVSGDEEVTIKWSDPADLTVEGAVLARWAKTIVVRKVGSAPDNAADGTVILEETTRNQYASTGYKDTGLTNGTTYYYGIFPCATSGATTLGTAVIGAPAAVYPSAATGLSVQTEQGAATVSFTKPADATRCDLVYKKDSAPTSASDGTKVSNYTSGTKVTGLTNGATYYFVVYTYNAKNRETASSAISSVIKSTVAVPTPVDNLVYNGSVQTAVWTGFDPDKLSVTGNTGTDAGTYTATFTPKGNFVWEDGTTTPKDVNWTIGRAPIADVPSQNGTITYSGSAQSPTWNNYNSSQLTLGGTTSSTDAGSYVATFTPKANYKWSDDTTTAKSVSWTIGRATITTAPSQNGELTYNGASQSPTWNNYSTTQLSLSGTTSGIDAGTYKAKFTPTKNYNWSDGSTTAKEINWNIGKAAGSSSLSKTSTTINMSSSTTDTVTVTRTGDGTVSASSSNSNIANVSVSGTTVTITGKAKGTATITVSVAEGKNHLAPSNKTIAVTVKTLEPKPPADATLDEIGEMIDAGYNDPDFDITDYWAVGNPMTVDVAQMTNPNTGVSGTSPWPAQKLTFVVTAFNHHTLATPINGKTKALITMQARECLNKPGTNWNKPNLGAYVNGNSDYDMTFTKWSQLPLRTWLNGTFLNALPAKLKSMIKPIKHNMLNNNGASSKTTESVTDSVFLPTYPEVFGNTAWSYYLNNVTPAGEEGTQWPYYATASNRIKYGNNNGASDGSACYWWEGSPSSYYNSSFGYYWCRVDADGNAAHYGGYSAFGVAPAFCL